jgi:hypothetical protein
MAPVRGLEPPASCFVDKHSDPTELHGRKLWQGRMDFNHRMAGSEPAALSAWLRPCGWESGPRSHNPRFQRPPLRRLSYLPIWGDRRESNSRRLVHSQPPEIHSATAPSGAGSGARIRVCRSSASRYTVSAIPANLVEMERIELSFDGCRPSVLPLNDIPVVAGDGNAPSRPGL